MGTKVVEKSGEKSGSSTFLERVKRLRNILRTKDKSTGVVVNFNNRPDWVDFKDGNPPWSKWDKYD
jgi:hypothetical protein